MSDIILPGNAASADVKTGKTFSSSSGANVPGAMPINTGTTITPGTADQLIPAGYHDGTTKVIGDANLTAANILSGKSIFGVAGNVIAGKRYASGTATSPTTSETYPCNPSSKALYTITVTGLTFQPSRIIVYYGPEQTSWSAGNTTTYPIFVASGGSAYDAQAVSGKPTATASGFNIPVNLGNQPFTWEAYE